MRFTIAALAAAGLTVPASAQPTPEPNDGKVVYRLSLPPAPPPQPLSSAYLLPEYRESIPGNKVQQFLRSFMEQDLLFGKTESDKRQKWNEMPLKDLPVDELKAYAGRLVDRDMYDAARMTQSDWQLWFFIRRDGVGTLLPDLQKMRSIAEVLKTRVRGEIAAGDHAAALRTMKVFFGLARTMDSHPTMIGQLVGVAIAQIACNALEEIVQTPGCPNLYWSLTDLPAPYFDLRVAVQGERASTLPHFDRILNATGPLSDEEMALHVKNFVVLAILGSEGNQADSSALARKYERWAADPKRVGEARDRLIAAGFRPTPPVDLAKEFQVRGHKPSPPVTAAAFVKTLSPLQVVVTDDIRQFEIYRDEQFRWLPFPFPRAMDGIKAGEKEAADRRDELGLAPLFLSDSAKVKTAQVRLDQRIAYLRVIEAVRLHALQNGGSLPTSLDDIKLPIPADPVTGKPFGYSVTDGVANLHGASLIPGDARSNRHYEITIRK